MTVALVLDAFLLRLSAGQQSKFGTEALRSSYRTRTSDGSTGVAWGGFSHPKKATPKKPRASPQATPNENMNFVT